MEEMSLSNVGEMWPSPKESVSALNHKKLE